MDEVPVFRVAKRRKFTRPREDVSPDSVQQPPALSADERAEPTLESNDNDHEEAGSGISTLIRSRKHIRKPVTGVQFSNMKAVHQEDPSPSTELVRSDESEAKPIDITGRFVGSTGQAVNVDKHMVAFIDSELARRRNTPVSSVQRRPADGSEQDSTASNDKSPPDEKKSLANATVARPLAEVDLGTSAHHLNLARTQAALERVKAGQAPIEDDVKPPKPRKPRLGRDGKPMKPRPRKRRNSEDLARDALVEQFLHENKIDIYDTSTPEPTNVTRRDGESGEGVDADDDEQFAERFRQEFMDAIAERRSKTKTTTQAKGAAATESRGPKLGGSRSARAKMAQIQQQQQQSGASSSKK
ncbi:hypothetical protein A1O7_00505 [Cladophialophora yegresii CBS 114405]|uniref:Uncharacterized protein n=1 Tax=Cladophialophora yegresii CBS 114405 TaxID=1182544 RepID=W9X0Z3_9EURO|nr:uncharacterized protein A1O7_00505 [Cladophialophora yegresii CBS 114405]EXJ64169.1 hypothetical protein A1O7_00505 [Cladophialophora yegresii CBS 114405]